MRCESGARDGGTVANLEQAMLRQVDTVEVHTPADVGAQPPRKDDFKVRTTDSGENRP